jgi:RNA polymerase sigma factor (TIGR02999 family)
VHEAFLRLVRQRELAWRDRAHFFGAASELIRRILVDHARARAAGKRGGEQQRLTIIGGLAHADPGPPLDLIALDDALGRLAEIDERQARIVEMRFFGGLTVAQVADLLEVGPRTVDREWCVARTWLYRALGGGEEPGAGRSAREDGPRPGT